jgi:DNA topoisomerase-1
MPREISGEDFTAKDFRTWAGTVLTATVLRDTAAFSSQRQARRNIARAIERVSCLLGNTPAICRRCYVHPDVIDAYLEQNLGAESDHAAPSLLSRSLRGLQQQEIAVMALIRARSRRPGSTGSA